MAVSITGDAKKPQNYASIILQTPKNKGREIDSVSAILEYFNTGAQNTNIDSV